MRKLNQNNRYYCHRRTKTGEVHPRKKTIFLDFDQEPDKYARRLLQKYNYSIQLQIR